MSNPTMTLEKNDYANLLKLLDRIEAKGLQECKYIAVLSLKLEQRVAAWFDGHPTGFDHVPKLLEAHAEDIKQAVESAVKLAAQGAPTAA